MEKITWTNEKRKVSELESAPYNPRKRTDKQTADLKRSLERFSLADPIVINKNGRVIGGHFRLKVLKEKGTAEVDVRVPSRELSEQEEKELNIRLNKNQGEWDDDLLRAFDQSLLLDAGFESSDLDRIFDPDYKKKDPDAAPEARRSTRIKEGDLFQLGSHRLLCGDATRQEDCERLMGGGGVLKADLIFTDPPYNVNYQGKGKNTNNTIKNDNLAEQSFREFLLQVFANYKENSKKDASLYCCYASRTHREFEDAINANGYEVKNQIIWVKLLASMGWGDYRWKHEPILYCRQAGSKSRFYGDHCQYTEWREELTDEEMLKRFKAMIQKEEAGGSTVWKLGIESNYKHPTQKPVRLINIALANSSRRGDIVIDFFGGSGSTLIACEDMGRICHTMELDPVYCQVILDRWGEYTGNKARLL